ncbi:Auxin efflux carrier family protein [Forsythia ovata]|uniref:Auxin efflux carrier family protein n=1 Tax=Forsythia ovata TaxID=205694 RepID=A0ABD1WBA8_9LAMI
MEPPMENYEIVGEEGEEHEQQPSDEACKPLLVEAEWPGIEDEEIKNSKTPLIARIFKTSSSVSQIALPDIEQTVEGSGNSPKPIRCLATPRVVRKIGIVAEQTPIWNILQPPTIASLFAIIVGMVPGIKNFVFGYDAPLSFVSDSLEILAGAMVPSVMLILGVYNTKCNSTGSYR